jgi:methionine--tRNA ligase beta chain
MNIGDKMEINVKFEDFQKLDIRVGKIKEVKEIEGSKNLYHLSIDLGDKEGSSVAGIANAYKKEDLLGKKIVVVTNLEPKKIRGILSNCMVLAALDNEKISLLVPDKDVTEGSKIF